jgi:Tfp pilus assembly protein PilN
MLESLLIALIVAAAALYAAWALTPASVRNGFLRRLVQALGGAEQPGLRGRLAAALQRLAQASGGGCSDCSAAKMHRPPADRRSPPD